MRFIGTLLGVVTWAAALSPAFGQPQPPAQSEPPAAIDFKRDVDPIFLKHCFSCHGPDRQSGGLRLDSVAALQKGGTSGQPILGGGVESNEILRRITSDNPEFRMPWKKPGLTEKEIATIRAWVEQGTPVGPKRTASAYWGDLWAKIEDELGYQRIWVFAIILTVGYVLLRSKMGVRRLRRRSEGQPQPEGGLQSWFANISWAWFFALLAVFAAWVFDGKARQAQARLALVQNQRPNLSSLTFGDLLGDPPVPPRPDHPPRLAGTYYRGNCERSPQLFNGGNYLTCTFHLDLVDAAGKLVVVGDVVDAEQLFLLFEIERAPNAVAELFTDQVMGSVYLTDIYHTQPGSKTRAVVPLTVVRPGEHWKALVPLRAKRVASATSDQAGQRVDRMEGWIYLYSAGERVSAGDVGVLSGTPHYIIRYDLRFGDGKVQPESDIWMTALFLPNSINHPQWPEKLPFAHWLDHRPIPVITGENSKDPKLLGTEEHLKPKPK